MRLPKILSIVLAAVIILNFLGFVLKLITPATFWLVTIAAAILAYKIIPNLAKKK